MSGPKSGSYRVVSTEEIQRRRLEAARQRFARAIEICSDLSAEIDAANTTYDELGVTIDIPPPPSNTDPETWEQASDRIEELAAAAKNRLGKARIAARAERLVSLGSGLEASLKSSPAQGTSKRLADDALASQVRNILAPLQGSDDSPLAEDAFRFASSVYQVNGQRRIDDALDHLRILVQRAVDREGILDRNRRIINGLLIQLDGLAAPPVEEIRRLIAALDLGAEMPRDLDVRVSQAREAAIRHLDREFALSQARNALIELGYHVGSDFATAVVSDGALLDLPTGGSHGVRVRERSGHLQFNVVRWASSTAIQDRDADTRAESTFCEDFTEFTAAIRRQGVELEMHRLDLPGESPVQVVDRPVDQAKQSKVQASRPSRRRSQ